MRRRREPSLTVIHIEHEDAELEIAGRVYFGEPARTYGPPDQCDPGGDDEVEDISVLRNGDKLSDAVVDKLELDWEKIFDLLTYQALQTEADDARGFDEDRADAERDR